MGAATAVMRELERVELDGPSSLPQLRQRCSQDLGMAVAGQQGLAAIERREQADARTVGRGLVGIEWRVGFRIPLPRVEPAESFAARRIAVGPRRLLEEAG